MDLKYVALVDGSVTDVSVPPEYEELVVLYHVDVSSKVMLVSFEQPSNAYQPILVTLSGMVMLASEVQL